MINIENTITIKNHIRATWLYRELDTNPIEIDDGGYIGSAIVEDTIFAILNKLQLAKVIIINNNTE